jgi:hydrogenase expression/formation protein HypC
MCLAVPGKIVKIEGSTATVDYGCEKRTAGVVGTKFKVGDYVIVAGKMVIQKVPEKQAIQSLKFYNEAVSR